AALSEAERPVTRVLQRENFPEVEQETATTFSSEIISEPARNRRDVEIFKFDSERSVEDSAAQFDATEEPVQPLDQRIDPLSSDHPAGNFLERTRLKFKKRKLRSKIIRAVNAIADEEPVRAIKVEASPAGPAVTAAEDEQNTSGIRLPDRNAVEAAMMEALAARSGKEAKKIELRLSDDEVPTDTDALQSFAIDQAVDLMVSPPKQTVAASPAVKAPKRIEWRQPEDDIPSEADVMEILAKVEFQETVETEMPAATALTSILVEKPSPAVFAAELVAETKDEEPSIPKIMPESGPVVPLEPPPPMVVTRPSAEIMEEVISEKELLPVPPVTAPFVSRLSAVAADFKPIRIEFDEPANDLGKPDKILEVKASEDPDRSPVVENDPDEITVVAPPSRRIRIDVKQPGRWKVTPPAGYRETFVPTLLGGSVDELPVPAAAADHKDPVLALYYGAADPNRRSPYRSLVIGAGFLMSVVLLLFGNVLVREEARTEAAANTVASKTFPPQSSPLQSTKTTVAPPAKDKPIKDVEKPAESEPNAGRGDRSNNRDNPITNKEQTKASPAKSEPQNRPTTSASVKPVNEKPRLMPSTIVISSDNGKVKSKVEPQEKQAARTGSATKKKSPGTRPRIVMVP
ncbi:MAG TPA: hypothetical protein VL572_11175, partial [Pyrinomonadaceae bacterium]|nr:hypothetical protein [Pyrinomonadaceae bacterium]